jgi:hypothetical protein
MNLSYRFPEQKKGGDDASRWGIFRQYLEHKSHRYSEIITGCGWL